MGNALVNGKYMDVGVQEKRETQRERERERETEREREGEGERERERERERGHVTTLSNVRTIIGTRALLHCHQTPTACWLEPAI